ncbi:MAG TPA: hypothetical protein VGO29_12555 [Solirubrobacteraceae bacterium]|nr:hypothetical protein [Solirubrobacteraceae bacterium]
MFFWSERFRARSTCATPCGSAFDVARSTYIADRRRRSEILFENAATIMRVVEDTQRQTWPEEAALKSADLTIVSNFASELDALERRVFALMADGMGYRATARRLGISVNKARQAYRSYVRKRQRFQLLYDAARSGGRGHPRLGHRPSNSEQAA